MSESEQQTRRTRIDTRLRARGWEIMPYRTGLRIGDLSKHAIAELRAAVEDLGTVLVALENGNGKRGGR